MLYSFDDFIGERKIELLLEANIKIEVGLLDILTSMKSPIAKKVVDLNGREVDVNTNYINYDINKHDKVIFKPDDKVEKIKYTFSYDGYYDILYKFTSDMKNELGLDNVVKIANGDLIEYENIDIESNNYYNDYKFINYYSKLYFKTLLEQGNIVLGYKYVDGNKNYSLINKQNIQKDFSSIKNSEIAVGRFTRALLKKADQEFTDKDIEAFVTEFKTTMRIKKDSFKNFSVVKGDDIKFWYNQRNNMPGGSLGSSCMKHDKCQEYFDIYTKNPNQVSMIILKSYEDESKICGRALLWTDTENRKFMDRIYINDNSHEDMFIEYAISNGYYYKEEQSFSNPDVMLNDKKVNISIMVKLDEYEFDNYPYVDTLKCLKDGVLYTDDGDNDYDYKLTSTEGGNGICDSCNGSGEISCGNCCGDAVVECHECYGSGEESCDECNNGIIECEECYGSGNIDEIDCNTCDGSGEISCNNCNNGKVDCSICDGSGDISCDECYNGVISCDEC